MKKPQELCGGLIPIVTDKDGKHDYQKRI